MKTVVFFAFISFMGITFSSEDIPGKYVERAKYSVVSDEFSEKVPAGKCMVKGKVISDDSLKAEGLISTLDRRRFTYTDQAGNFQLLLNETDTSLFFFKEGWEEIVIWKYPFKSQHVVTINFYPQSDMSMMIVDKPVIYLYNEEPLSVDISLNFKGDFKFTYPEYKDGWYVQLDQHNQIKDSKTGRTYPYLFWEGEMNTVDFSAENGKMEGFVLDTKNTISFLEEKLTRLGLNQTEKTDFITFWGPRMIKSPYALVQFIVDEEYEQRIAGISVQPQPDSKRRIYMIFAPIENAIPPFEIIPQDLPAFERKGFTLVEWGGSEINVHQIFTQ